MGFRQFGQRETLKAFAEEYFNLIEDCVNKRSWSLTRYIYMFLAPNMCATDDEIARFTALKDKLEAYTEEEKKEGTTRLLNWVKDSI